MTRLGVLAINVNVIHIHMGVAMSFAARMDDFGRPAWIAATILGFIFFWPAGLALLVFSARSGRMGCWHHGDRYSDRWQARAERWRDRADRAQQKAERWFGGHGGRHHSSGNRAFDEYRMETLRRLEEEQDEFMQFLDRLRMAKDKSEFDEFLNERRRRASEGPEQHPPA
ncbi:MAG TPA: DUF2852 domain-containing protein [Magnetospirillaceae bacterium]